MKKMLALGLTVFALAFMLVGCYINEEEINDDSSNIQEETESSQNTQEENSDIDSQSENISSTEYKLGMVTYAEETYINVNLYEIDEEICEYTAVDFSTMTDSATIEKVDLAEKVEYYKVYDGTLLRASSDELTIGKYVLVEYEDDLQKIIIYSTEESTEENTETENITTDDIAEE